MNKIGGARSRVWQLLLVAGGMTRHYAGARGKLNPAGAPLSADANASSPLQLGSIPDSCPVVMMIMIITTNNHNDGIPTFQSFLR